MHDGNPSGTSMKSLYSKTTHRGLRLSVLMSLPGFPRTWEMEAWLLRGLVASSTSSPPTHSSPCDLAGCNARSQQHRVGSMPSQLLPVAWFSPLTTGQDRCIQECVQRSLPNHYNIWSTSPCYPGEGQMGTACLPPTGAGPSKGMQTLSSIDVFKILPSLWTSMECVTLPTDCATFQPPSFYDITHFNYLKKKMALKNLTIKIRK